ncbi:MAG: nitrile hydratase subunit beta, partial [Rhodospirillaceae bacterium]|nr:nitrile hydratase subunit beta [Rhodospirillaceae bacterium]
MSQSRFQPGERVSVIRRYPHHHHRAPDYIKGRTGVIERLCGIFGNPETLAHHGDGRLDTGSERGIGLTYDLSDSNLTAEVARTGAMAVIDDFDERFDDSVDTPERSRGKTSMFIPVVY